MGNLSIFVDESGDFGEYRAHSPYYIITMVFHEQDNDIRQNIQCLDESLKNMGYRVRKVCPKDYKLFQAGDLVCTLHLLAIKHKGNELTHSELLIFHSPKDLKKQFLKPIQKKRFARN